MVRSVFVMLVTLTMLTSPPRVGHAQEVTPLPTDAAQATPGASSAEIATEVLATISVPADAIPPLPAIFNVWLWSLPPDAELRPATEELPPSTVADVVLDGEYSVRSGGQLHVQRATERDEVPAGNVVTVRAGDAVIYGEYQVVRIMRNPGDETSQALSFGVFSAAPPSTFTEGAVSQEDWERSGLAGQDLTVRVERLTVPPGGSLPVFVPDVQTPRIFAVVEGVAHRAIVSPDTASPRPAASVRPGQVLKFRTLGEGEQLQLRNDQDQPLVLLQVTLSADRTATPVAATPMP